MQILLLTGVSQLISLGRQEVKDIGPDPSAIKRASKVRHQFVMIPTMEIFHYKSRTKTSAIL